MMPKSMTREDLLAGRVDLTGESTGEKLAPVPPGATLRDFMADHGLSARRLAADLGVPPNRITGILLGERAITAATALRLAARFDTSAEYWMNLQTGFDLARARIEMRSAA